MHWSVVAILVNLVALALYTTAVASHHWATKTDAGYATHAGLFTACPKINGTCYDTHYHFNEYSHEKGVIIASAVLNVFALIGYYFFTVLSVFFLCGLYEEKRLATYAIITAYFAGFLAAIGIAMYAVAIKRLDYSLSWSFVLAVLGLIVNMAAGILMCVGRNISKMATDEEKPTSQHPIENIDLDVTRRKQWHEEEGQEFGGKLPRKKPLPGASK
ncbi:hypothetical protein DPMN_094764 [Dreissena polymorpha]|uniref:Uncharacterized protein n=2 Tax=Dreissena polymorpha TaxID=45954 RepID=A0A9D4L636_DREPO|nr:hypothetical protein DPMN_094764 [Dreissena polymorpha]